MRDLTSAEQAAADVLRSDDTDEIRAVLRRMSISDLNALGGISPSGNRSLLLTPDSLGYVAVDDVVPSAAAVAEAVRQRDLRQQGTSLALAVLRAYGQRYDSHAVALVPWATDTGTLGFIGQHTGHAVATDLPLPDELVQACTLPEPRRSTLPPAPDYDGPAAPDGWVELDHVDVREDLHPPTQPAELDEPPKARIVWWGLRTIYGTAGAPGITTIAGGGALSHAAAVGVGPHPGPAGMRPAQWPADDETRARVDRIGRDWLDRATQHLAAEAGVDPEVGWVPDSGGDISALVAGWPGPVDPHGVVATAVRRAGIAAVASACRTDGDRLSRIRALLCRILVPRLRPVAEALHGQVGRLHEVLTPVADALADHILAPLAWQAHATGEAMVAEYYRDGPVPVDIPLYPAQLTPDPDDPVAASEIALAAGVDRETVGAWQRRHDSFPQPRWTVGGRGAYRWGDVAAWLRATGRMA